MGAKKDKETALSVVDKPLTDLQERFVQFYIMNKGNGTDAARQAGYKGNDNVLAVTAHNNLRNPKIRAQIERRYSEMAMGQNEILALLGEHGRGNLTQFIGLSIEQLKAHPLGHLIKRVKIGTIHISKEEQDRKKERKRWKTLNEVPGSKPPAQQGTPDQPAAAPAAVPPVSPPEDESITYYVESIELHDPQAAMLAILKHLQLTSGQPTEIVAIMPSVIEALVKAGLDPKGTLETLARTVSDDADPTTGG